MSLGHLVNIGQDWTQSAALSTAEASDPHYLGQVGQLHLPSLERAHQRSAAVRIEEDGIWRAEGQRRRHQEATLNKTCTYMGAPNANAELAITSD